MHCYRMLGSFEEAEDALQEAFLRAWRARATQTQDSQPRAWLYKIATNVCLDALRRNQRQVPTLESKADVPWLQPYPDRLLDEVAPPEQEPDAVVVARETIELTFIALIQLLPAAPARGGDPARRARLVRGRDRRAAGHQRRRGQQRAPARARDAARRAPGAPLGAPGVLRRPHRRGAAAAGRLHRRPRGGRRGGLGGADARGHPRHDAPAADGLRRPRRDRPAARHARSAPRAWASGAWCRRARTGCPPPRATCASRGETEWRAFKLDILRCQDGGVAEVTTFGAALFEQFGLPPVLDER